MACNRNFSLFIGIFTDWWAFLFGLTGQWATIGFPQYGHSPASLLCCYSASVNIGDRLHNFQTTQTSTTVYLPMKLLRLLCSGRENGRLCHEAYWDLKFHLAHLSWTQLTIFIERDTTQSDVLILSPEASSSFSLSFRFCKNVHHRILSWSGWVACWFAVL